MYLREKLSRHGSRLNTLSGLMTPLYLLDDYTISRLCGDEDDKDALKVSLEQSEALLNAEEKLQTVLEDICSLEQKTAFLQLPVDVANGYLAGKVVDTKSNFDTIGALFLSGISSYASTVLIERLFKSESLKKVSSGNQMTFRFQVMCMVNNTETAIAAIKEVDGITNKDLIVQELESLKNTYNILSYLNIAVSALSGYHGYKRNNDSTLYGLAWLLFGSGNSLGLALEQGFAKPLQ